MTNENFEKLFSKDHTEAMLATFSKVEFPKLKTSTKEENRKIVEQKQQVISPELDQAIQRYINEHKGRVNGKQLRSMVKKHFGITVV